MLGRTGCNCLLKLFTWGMELLTAWIAQKLNLSRTAKWILRSLTLLPGKNRYAANLEDHLLVRNVIFKKLEKCFCLDQLSSTQMPWEKKVRWLLPLGHYSSKGSFQTQVTGWAPKEKTRPRIFLLQHSRRKFMFLL